jgi:hypothetical protein
MPAKRCAFCQRPLGRYAWKTSEHLEYCNEVCASAVEDGFVPSPPLAPRADQQVAYPSMQSVGSR